jgi:hypothetical protein
MPIGPIEHGKFKIENQSDADVCLREVFKEPNYRSMDEVYHVSCQTLRVKSWKCTSSIKRRKC